ncbi:hypothetical protein RJZ56_001417 [Blastomyces dermatitidis]|uniref:Kinetochore protein Fta7 n=2 Tax=Ajellomyces dermatitidis TaxID=5039 RepID=F2T363_AJEDA|nr:uncharacterized protein BDCG_02665 [Blastomyces dermatitidis ER-3]EEQ87545.1 hypothetical protein BDCG_02665 [Blastomyces dermatitidis ER-3]EGE77865.1 hypothetical protein BDDG_00802 [Blastomyces dermatitidis ATCC 18188]EQL38159.1 hypothetical protein BDFG_00536 [Blastomyces dermatitidis ATCC 26199]
MPPKRKQRSDDADERQDEGEHDSKSFAMLKPRTRHISERTIKTKWTTLPDSVQEKIKELFRSIERPVVVRHRDERKRIEAQSAVLAVRKNLGRRLPRMPFPPGTQDADFDYEAALDDNRALELQLATAANSADLLRAEIKREEAQLARERAQLEELEKNARTAQVERKRQTRNAHPVIRRLERSGERSDGSTDFTFTGPKDNTSMLCEIDPDSELYPLIKQLRSHLESMQNNATQVAGLREAIIRSQSCLNLLPLG